jgi:hypothetical protein
LERARERRKSRRSRRSQYSSATSRRKGSEVGLLESQYQLAPDGNLDVVESKERSNSKFSLLFDKIKLNPGFGEDMDKSKLGTMTTRDRTFRPPAMTPEEQ